MQPSIVIRAFNEEWHLGPSPRGHLQADPGPYPGHRGRLRFVGRESTAIGCGALLALVHAYLRWALRHPVAYERARLVFVGTALVAVYAGTTVLLPDADALITMALRLVIIGIVAGAMVAWAARDPHRDAVRPEAT